MATSETVMKKHRLTRLAARASIVILAFGFFLIGLLCLVTNQRGYAENGVSICSTFAIIGGATSSLLGGIFLIAGCLNWNRFPFHG
jgi:hypothetical protein